MKKISVITEESCFLCYPMCILEGDRGWFIICAFMLMCTILFSGKHLLFALIFILANLYTVWIFLNILLFITFYRLQNFPTINSCLQTFPAHNVEMIANSYNEQVQNLARIKLYYQLRIVYAFLARNFLNIFVNLY